MKDIISPDPLIIKGTEKTPHIHFDANIGLIEIKGCWTINLNSTPVNSLDFEKPLVDWLDQYCMNPWKQTIVVANLDQLEPPGNICLLNVFTRLEKIYRANNQVVVYWYYEDGNMVRLEEGEDYASIVRVPFKMISYKV